ncbi:pentapeptide repeat-containing protein, partial [Moorena sp. SIO4G3]|uniref:pentapeptide repeat-containing protein n=1 Tax=Moorena sp. SIO4G3 TaxID=2607821 RepID=UPI00142CE143
ASLNEANLAGADLYGAQLSGVDLSGARLIAVVLDQAQLDGAKMVRVYLSDASLQQSNLRGADLNRAYLSGTRFNGANLQHADLHGVNLLSADLSQVDLSFASLNRAYMSDTTLEQANLAQADLRAADLTRARLHRTTAAQAIFKGNSGLSVQQRVALINAGAIVHPLLPIDEPDLDVDEVDRRVEEFKHDFEDRLLDLKYTFQFFQESVDVLNATVDDYVVAGRNNIPTVILPLIAEFRKAIDGFHQEVTGYEADRRARINNHELAHWHCEDFSDENIHIRNAIYKLTQYIRQIRQIWRSL